MEAIYQNLLQASQEAIQAKQAPTICDLEAVWSRYKYLVLEYSPGTTKPFVKSSRIRRLTPTRPSLII